MQAIHFLFAALFLYVAFLQLNDPDPTYWIAVWVGVALIAAAKGIGRYSEFWTAVAIGAVLAGMFVSAPLVAEYFQSGNLSSIFGAMGSAQYVEATREFFGLLIALVVLVAYVKR